MPTDSHTQSPTNGDQMDTQPANAAVDYAALAYQWAARIGARWHWPPDETADVGAHAAATLAALATDAGLHSPASFLALIAHETHHLAEKEARR